MKKNTSALSTCRPFPSGRITRALLLAVGLTHVPIAPAPVPPLRLSVRCLLGFVSTGSG